MGDAYKEEFSPEELKALEGDEGGESAQVTEDKGPDTQEEPHRDDSGKPPEESREAKTETEQKETPATKTEEEQAAASFGFRLETDDKGKTYVVDEDGTRIPAGRWKTLYRDYKDKDREVQTLREKHDLFRKLGAEKYYEVYPEEKPEGYAPPQPKPSAPTGTHDPLKMVFWAKDPNNQYNGMTLEQIKDIDPFFANVLYNQWSEGERVRVSQQIEAQKKAQANDEADCTALGVMLSKEFFGVDDPDTLPQDKMKSLLARSSEVFAYAQKHGLKGYKTTHVYQIMTHDEQIRKAREEGAKGTIKSLTQDKGIKTIDTAGGKPERDESMAAMEKWSDSQLTSHIDKMDEKAYTKFLKDAPPKILARLGM